MVTIMAFET